MNFSAFWPADDSCSIVMRQHLYIVVTLRGFAAAFVIIYMLPQSLRIMIIIYLTRDT